MKRWCALLLILCLLTGCGGQEPLVLIPDVVGTEVSVAQTVLTDRGLIPVVKSEPSAEAAGTVLRTDPPAGVYAAQHSKVYLYVAADNTTTITTTTTTTTVPFTVSGVPLTTTGMLSLPTVTQPIPTTDPCGAGHAYTEGVCTRCGACDPTYIPTLTVGDTWTVTGQWTFTLLGATAHEPCRGGDDRVVLLHYRYENLGFDSAHNGLYMDGEIFAVTDGQNASATLYPCSHKQRPQICAAGAFCTADEAYAVAHGGDLMLTVSLLTTNGQGVAKARFRIPLT